MNRTLCFVVLFATALIMTGIVSEDSDAEVGDTFTDGILVYEVTGTDTACVHSILNDYVVDLVIPDTVEHGGASYNVTSIDGLWINDPVSVSTIHIGKYVSEISKEPKLEDVLPHKFPGLTKYTVDAENQYFAAKDGALFDKGLTTLYAYPMGADAQTFTIPATVTKIVRGAFACAFILDEIKVESGNTAFVSENGVLYDVGKTTLIAYPAAKSGTVPTMPSSVTRFEMYSFAGAYIEKITIPDSVTDFGNYVFLDCRYLETVTLGKGVTKLDTFMFENCDSLRKIVVKGDSTTITLEPLVFMGCSSIKSFESGRDGYELSVFYDQGFTEEYDFRNNYGDITLYLRWVKAGEEPDIGATFTDGVLVYEITGEDTVRVYNILNNNIINLVIPDKVMDSTGKKYKVTSIDGIWTSGYNEIQSIHIGKYVSELSRAEKLEDVIPLKFYYLTKYTVDVENQYFVAKDGALFNKGLTTLYAYPMESELKTFTIPKTVTEIVRGVFASAYNLSEIKVESGNTTYVSENGILYDIEKKTLVAYPAAKSGAVPTIPGSVTRIEMYAFAGTLIKEFTIPDSVTDFGNYVFIDCYYLETITLGKGVTKLDAYFFADCDSLKTVIVNGDIDTLVMEKYVFSGCYSIDSFKSGRSGYNLSVFYDQGFTEEYDFGYNSDDITLYLEWTEKSDDSNAMIIGFGIGIIGIIILFGVMYVRRLY